MQHHYRTPRKLRPVRSGISLSGPSLDQREMYSLVKMGHYRCTSRFGHSTALFVWTLSPFSTFTLRHDVPVPPARCVCPLSSVLHFMVSSLCHNLFLSVRQAFRVTDPFCYRFHRPVEYNLMMVACKAITSGYLQLKLYCLHVCKCCRTVLQLYYDYTFMFSLYDIGVLE